MEFRQHKTTEDKKPTRFYSARQEKAVAKAVGGRKTANSGATPYDKGDVTTPEWLLECKTIMKDQESRTIHKEWFNKNRDESLFMRKKYNAVVVNFGPNSPNYYIVDEATFLEMKEALESVKDDAK